MNNTCHKCCSVDINKVWGFFFLCIINPKAVWGHSTQIQKKKLQEKEIDDDVEMFFWWVLV